MSKNTPETVPQRLLPFTHDELVQRAERWLYSSARCNFAIMEPRGHGLEIPDAIGWRYDGSILVECKVTRADFRHDRKKPHREVPAIGLGKYRWFLCPRGLIKPDELPKHWGLLYCYPTMIRRIKQAEPFPQFNQHAEVQVLYHCAQSYKAQRNAYQRMIDNPSSIKDSPVVLLPTTQSDPIPQRQLMPVANLL